ncbi:MAG: hypothetical protein JSV51_02325 [Candidatus Bathyarchaeota archaeon]|nr:MAG: hypothetical protein JSV51_02325 [Candidatus Bathyarchaeota archaeon]
MELRSGLGIEHRGFFFFTLFYATTGIANLVILGIHSLGLFHVTIVAVLSLIAAFGLYRLQSWTLWFIIGLFFIGTTYIAIMLNISIASYATNSDITTLFTTIAWTIYLILTWISVGYITAKRKILR